MLRNNYQVSYNIRSTCMSISNKIKFVILTSVMLFAGLIQANAIPLRVLEGGIPMVDPQDLIDEGIRLGSSELLRQAWQHYEDSLSLSGATPMASLEMGKIYYHLSLLGESTEEDFDTAEFFARQAVDDNPESADAHRALGLILAGRGAYLDALEEINLALYLNPGNQLLIYDLAALHIALHQPKKTIELLEGRNHDSGWPYVVLSLAWMQQNQRGKAILSLMKAKKLGYSGYWIDQIMGQLADDLDLPLD